MAAWTPPTEATVVKSTPWTPPPEAASVGQPSTLGALWEGFQHGLGNIAMGGARLGAKAGLGYPGMSEDLDKIAPARERQYQQQPTGGHQIARSGGELGGEMVATAPLAGIRAAGAIGKIIPKAADVLSGWWGRLLEGGVQGAAGGVVGAANSAPGGDKFMPAVGEGAATGGVVGTGLGAVGAAVRPPALEAPRVPAASLVNAPEAKSWRDAARMLTSGGVRLSPGQARNIGYKERSLQEWPVLRGLVRGQVGRSVDDFNRAVVSQALSPIGAIVPRSVRAGHDLMDFGTRQVDRAFARVLPHLTFNQQGAMAKLQGDPELARMVSEMATDDARQLGTIVQNAFGRFSGSPVMDGSAFKAMERSLSNRAATLRGGKSDDVGRVLDHVLGSLRDELETQNPRWAPELQKINHAFSMWARVRAAANRNADGAARFTPRDMLQILKSEDPSSGGNSFNRGREPMQAFAEAGSEIIDPSLTIRVPETSKSAARMVGDLIGGAAGFIPYGLAARAQQIPGLGRGIGALAPGAGAAAGPHGGKIIERRRIRPQREAQ